MLKRLTQCLLVATLGVVLSVAFSGTAQAEQCQQATSTWSGATEPYTICLVTDTSQPFVPPVSLQFKVPAEVTSLVVAAGPYGANLRDAHLAQQGLPENMNLWEATLNAGVLGGDGPITISTRGTGPNELDIKASFGASVLTPATGYSLTIKRIKQQVVAIYSFEARVTVKALVRISLNSFKGETQILTHRGKTATVEPGLQELRVILPWKVVKKKCGTKTAPHCSVLAVGQAWSGDTMIDQGTNARKPLKVPKQRKHPKRHVHKQ